MTDGNDTPTPTMPPAASSTFDPLIIAERYKVKEKLGQGGMGRVYRCLDTVLNRNVAVKLLNFEQCDQQYVVRFQQEARAASQLNHNNILLVLDFGLTEKFEPFMVMELVSGNSLDDRVATAGRLSLTDSFDITMQIAQGMQHAHRHGVIHRDLKPSNIMLVSLAGNKSKALILDFGIAKLVDGSLESGRLTMTGQIIGSPRYLSPEQARGDDLDGRSDVYSLGCVLFEMLTGTPPYQGDTALETITMHLNEPTPRLSERAGVEFPDELQIVVEKALAKDVDDRFSSMDEFRSALEKIPITIEEHTTPLSKPERANQAPSRYAIGLVCITLIVVMVAVMFVFLQRTSLKGESVERKKSIQSEEMRSHTLDMPDDKDIPEEVLRPGFAENTSSPWDTFVLKTGVFTPATLTLIEKDKRYTSLRLLAGTTIPRDVQFRIFSSGKWTSVKMVGCKVDPRALKGLAKMTNLEVLHIGLAGLSDKNLGDIVKAKNLTLLGLNRNRFTPSGLKKLAVLKQLQTLNLEDIGLTDAGLLAISEIKSLRKLSVRSNDLITKRGVEYFRNRPVNVLFDHCRNIQPERLPESFAKQGGVNFLLGEDESY